MQWGSAKSGMGLAFPLQAIMASVGPVQPINDWIFQKKGATIDTPSNLKAAKILEQWIKKGYFPSDINAIEYTDAANRFTKGEGVFTFNGDWQNPAYDAAMPGQFNQILRFMGLGSITRAWLGDFDWALPAVGLIAIMLLTLMPFISIFTTALYPSGTIPDSLSLPANPQWGNFVEVFKVANMAQLLASSTYIVVAVVPIALIISTMAAFAIGLLKIRGSGVLLGLFVLELTLPFGGIIVPLYYLERWMGIYNTPLAIVLPLIGLYMPLAVFWMRAHFISISPEISEAARVDGATTWDLF